MPAWMQLQQDSTGVCCRVGKEQRGYLLLQASGGQVGCLQFPLQLPGTLPTALNARSLQLLPHLKAA